MAPRPGNVLLRWAHLRKAAEYREILENLNDSDYHSYPFHIATATDAAPAPATTAVGGDPGAAPAPSGGDGGGGGTIIGRRRGGWRITNTAAASLPGLIYDHEQQHQQQQQNHATSFRVSSSSTSEGMLFRRNLRWRGSGLGLGTAYKLHNQVLLVSSAKEDKDTASTANASSSTTTNSSSLQHGETNNIKAEFTANSSVHTIETEDESEQEDVLVARTKKSVRWADGTKGDKLAVVHSYDSLPCLSTRIVILLLDLEYRVFEFVQCEFSTDKRLVVLDMLRQLPSFASLDRLTQQRYRILCRSGEEMINMLPIQHYNVNEGEILFASSAEGGTTPRQVMMAAATLLQEKKLIRAVRKAKLSGRALQQLWTSEELLYACETDTAVNQEQVTVMLDQPNVSSGAFEEDDNDNEGDGDDDDDNNNEESGLIVKVMSREFGEDANFADFSFPAFVVKEDDEMNDDAWFHQMFATTDVMVPPSTAVDTFSFSVDFAAPLQDDDQSFLGALTNNDGQHQHQQINIDSPEEVPSSLTWSEDDAITKAFATFGKQLAQQ